MSLGLLAALAWTEVAQAAQKTFTVLVGAEHVSAGATVNAFFPDSLLIHTGDTVHWKRNAEEIHTVSFLAGTPLPDLVIPAPQGLPSPVMFNPVAAFPTAPVNGQYDGTTFANSGIQPAFTCRVMLSGSLPSSAITTRRGAPLDIERFN